MSDKLIKRPILAAQVPARTKRSNYPAVFAAKMLGRTKQPLGDFFDLHNFGVNLTELQPGARSSLSHYHTKQDEFIYVLEGQVTLILDETEYQLHAGMCCGFPAMGAAHSLVNKGDKLVRYLEIGDRTEGDEGVYPHDDLMAHREDNTWIFTHKDGSSYDE